MNLNCLIPCNFFISVTFLLLVQKEKLMLVEFIQISVNSIVVFFRSFNAGAAASKAASVGVPIDSCAFILATANWYNQSTFARFYHRPLDAPMVAGAVFESLERPML